MERLYVEINGSSLFGERGIRVREIVVVTETSYFGGYAERTGKTRSYGTAAA